MKKNQDKFKTADERVKAFNEWCRSRECTECVFEGKYNLRVCALYWLDLGAEEEKPLSCPICGRDIEIRTIGDYRNRSQVQCTCGYRGAWCDSKEDAIAVHNCMARAVMAANEKGVKE